MQRFKDILCVAASDSDSRLALERAVALADSHQASLTFAKVIEEIPPNTKLYDRVMAPNDLQAKMIEDSQKDLQAIVDSLNNSCEITTKILVGMPFLEIIREVIAGQHDLLIKMAENTSSLLGRVFVSDDMHILRKCPCPVWLLKPESPKSYKRILATVDVDDSYPLEELETRHLLNLQVLEMASLLALSESAELHVVHAWEAFAEGSMRGPFINVQEEEIADYVEQIKQHHSEKLHELMDKAVTQLGKDAMDYVKPETHLLKGSPRKQIPSLVDDIEADLIVMGTVARTGIPGLIMGNTAETILNQIDCSVLAIKPTGFETPVAIDK